MKRYLTPKTKFGKYSIYLTLFFWVFMAIFAGFIKVGYRGGDTFFSNPPLAIPISLAGICGILAFIVGILSFFKKEKSLIVLLATLWGGFVILFIFGEIFSPH